MDGNVITCTKCGNKIPLNEAITHQIREKIEREKEAEYKEKMKKETERIARESKQKAEEVVEEELKQLRKKDEDNRKAVKELRKKELDFATREQELQEKEEFLQLEVKKQINEQRQQIVNDTEKRFNDQHALELEEKDRKIRLMEVQVTDLSQKLKQGSQEAQGEVLEEELEAILKSKYQYDLIEPIKKGKKGADILQQVVTPSGQHCGTILWEAKKTKSWSNEWVSTLKSNMLLVKAVA